MDIRGRQGGIRHASEVQQAGGMAGGGTQASGTRIRGASGTHQIGSGVHSREGLGGASQENWKGHRGGISGA